jgi:hypothetical protein
MPEYVLFLIVGLILAVDLFVTNRAARQARARDRSSGPMTVEMAELRMKVTALEEKALELQTGQRLTAGDLNGLPNNR